MRQCPKLLYDDALSGKESRYFPFAKINLSIVGTERVIAKHRVFIQEPAIHAFEDAVSGLIEVFSTNRHSELSGQLAESFSIGTGAARACCDVAGSNS